MTNDINKDWANASWQGSRIMQLEKSLELTPRQRFEALEELTEVSNWLANSGKKYHFNTLTTVSNKE